MKKLLLSIACSLFAISFSYSQWQQTAGPGGGRISCLFENGGNLFAGTPNGGIFRSTNNGISWKAINTGLPINVQFLTVSGFVASGFGLFVETTRIYAKTTRKKLSETKDQLDSVMKFETKLKTVHVA